MTTAELATAFLSEAPPPRRPEPTKDQWDRYVLPNPETGKEQSWVRATTFARTCADMQAISGWKERKTAEGVAKRPDLIARAAAVREPDSKKGKGVLREIAEQAQEFAGSSVRRTLGSAVHEFLEAIDLGEVVTAPTDWQGDLLAYQTELRKAGITLSKNYIERICLVPSIGVAGTMDRLAKFPTGDPFVLDIKTGTDLRYSWSEIAIQLALYARSTHCWDPVGAEGDGRLIEMPPKVNTNVAVVAHVPAGEGRCVLYYVNISDSDHVGWDEPGGWAMVEHCLAVRRWRNRKNLAHPVLPKE